MFVIIFFFSEIFDEMDVFSISNINRTGSLSTEFVKMFIGKVSMEFYIMEMIVFVWTVFGFSGYGAEPVIMAITILIKNSGASG